MQVILEAIEGPGVGTLVIVRSGQCVSVGRTAWADFSIPGDAEMSDVHFELDFSGESCCLRTQGTAVTAINGEPASEARLRPDDKVTAGQTTFTVQLPEGIPAPLDQEATQESDSEAAESKDETPSPENPTTAVEYSKTIKLGDEAKALLTDELTPAEFFELLVAEPLFSDAILFMARWLPKQDAVGWGCECLAELLSDGLTPLETEALQAAQSWVEDPSEKNCRVAEAAAQHSEFEGPTAWLALAAFWSGESLAPPDLPPVSPPEGLTAQGVSAALTLAATVADPAVTEERYTQFLEKGRAVAKQAVSAPDES